MAQLLRTSQMTMIAHRRVHASVWSLLVDVAHLGKLRIAGMVVGVAYIGYVMAPGMGFALDGAVAATLAGIALSCVGAGMFNQVMERDVDAQMPRTADRPVAAGRISPRVGLVLAAACTVGGLVILLSLTNVLTAGLTALTIASYALLYTPLKRITSLSTLIGAIPGALPPVLGYAAAAGAIDARAATMFAILFFWQLPHFFAIAWIYKDQYSHARVPMLPVVDDATGRRTFRQILVTTIALLVAATLPTVIGMAGMLYLVGSTLAGLAFLAFAGALFIKRTRAHARAVFFASLVYVPVIYALMAIDKQ